MDDRNFVWVPESVFDRLEVYAGAGAVTCKNGPGKWNLVLNGETVLTKEFSGIDLIYYARKDFLDKFKKQDKSE